MSGKGSAPRPFEVPKEVYDTNHARIFGAPKKKEAYVPPPLPDATPRFVLANRKQPHEAEMMLVVMPDGTEAVPNPQFKPLPQQPNQNKG